MPDTSTYQSTQPSSQLSFSPRSYKLAQQARALSQLQHLPAHSALAQILQVPYKYGIRTSLESPLAVIKKLANASYQANLPLPQPTESPWTGDYLSNIALSFNAIPSEIKPYAWVETLYFGDQRNLTLPHLRLGVIGLSHEPLYLDHSNFIAGLNLQYARMTAPTPAIHNPGLTQSPPLILDLSQSRIFSEFTAGDNSYLTTLRIADVADCPPVIKCSAYEQNSQGIITRRYEASAAIPIEPQLLSLEELKFLNAFDTFKVFESSGSVTEVSCLPYSQILENLHLDLLAAYNALVRSDPGYGFSAPSWSELAGAWKR